MTPGFEVAVAEILHQEGGYSDDPMDPGGATNFGISLRFALNVGDLDHDGHPDLDIDGDGDIDAADIRALSPEAATQLYEAVFWQPLRCDDMPLPIALAVCDTAVNMGRGPAVVLLQTAASVPTDGRIGPVTLHAVREQVTTMLLARFTVLRIIRYTTLENYARYGRGWIRRAVEIDRAAMRLTEEA
jgi:lysozyme family protein